MLTLARSWPSTIKMADVRITEKTIERVSGILSSGNLREGTYCRDFEEEFAKMVGAEHAVACNSGSAALHAAYSYYLQSGDEVLVPAMTFFATASMVCWAGGVPVFCDINPQTYCLDLDDARKRITPKTRAIAPVHLFGNAADVEAILDLAAEFELHIIWDAAQAHLTEYRGKDVGSLTGACCYSFYATKNMTTGEGGMVVSDDRKLADFVRLLKRQGQAEKYRHTILGTNYRMTDIQAVIGLEQLENLAEQTNNRRRSAARYDAQLADVVGLQIPFMGNDVRHSYHLYTISVDPTCGEGGRDGLRQVLQAANIQTTVNYPVPLHKQPVFIERYGELPFLKNAEKMASRCLSLPLHPHLSEAEIDYVSDVIKLWSS